MLTSGTVSVCNTLTARSHLIEHLEDHEKGEFDNKPTPGFHCLVEERNQLYKENTKLRQRLTAMLHLFQKGMDT